LESSGAPKSSASNLAASFRELEVRISDEIHGVMFMHIPSERAAFYDQADLFGKDVIAKFPTVQFDVVEAGNCYAAGRGTAVVFHLMRIMEKGVQAFGTKLGVPLTGSMNWQTILDRTNPPLKALAAAKDPTAIELSEAASSLFAIKVAWRNVVMHPNDTYTLEEAEKLMRLVRIFMEQLAKII
jgi:hypothetical protein